MLYIKRSITAFLPNSKEQTYIALHGDLASLKSSDHLARDLGNLDVVAAWMERQKQKIPRELLDNPTTGPKPITIQEYRERQRNNAAQKTQEPVIQKKIRTRGGKQVRYRKDIANLYRLVTLAVTKAEKNIFLNQIRELREEEERRKNERKTYRDGKL